MAGLRLSDPLGYLDFLKLMSCAKIVLTDSGGIQEETTILGIPCLTLRENTERPVTVELGSNCLVGTQTQRIVEAYRRAANNGRHDYQVPPLWDGRAAERIVKILLDKL
jgi:UDP-N-acetylglucosamine 2-epimerase (non-hydrolysing)